MKADLLGAMGNAYLLQARDAYITLMGLYEDFCGGPREAMAYREYFAIRDNIAAIDRELRSRKGA